MGTTSPDLNFCIIDAVCVCILSHVWLFASLGTIACSSVHGIFQARILEWVVISFSSGSSWHSVSCVSYIGRQILYPWATQKAPILIIK